MTFLIVGENPLMDSSGHAANTIRLAKFDFGHRQIHVLTLPSEMWVNTPALQLQGINRTKLTLVYYESKRRAPGSDQARMGVAAGILAQTLENNFGYYPDHYIVIKPNSLPDMIDAVGGIDLTLPIAVDGRSQGKGYYPAGSQHLDGDQVLDLVLVLQSGDSQASTEWKKYELPTLVLQAVDRALNLPKNSLKIPSLMDIFAKVALTDLSIKNILDLTCLVNNPDIHVNMDSIGPEMLTGGSGQDLLPRVDLLSKFITDSVGK
jgi:anionic cell wall polymer biosynthesis LytR-Cps2A-Psr (LCP) family protein